MNDNHSPDCPGRPEFKGICNCRVNSAWGRIVEAKPLMVSCPACQIAVPLGAYPAHYHDHAVLAGSKP